MATERRQFKKNVTHELVVLPNSTQLDTNSDNNNNYAQLKTIRSPKNIYERSTPQLNDTDIKLSVSESKYDQEDKEIQSSPKKPTLSSNKRNKRCYFITKIIMILVIIVITTAVIMSALIMAVIGLSKASNGVDNLQNLEATVQHLSQQVIELEKELNTSMKQLQAEIKQQVIDLQSQINSSENTLQLLTTDINEHVNELKDEHYVTVTKLSNQINALMNETRVTAEDMVILNTTLNTHESKFQNANRSLTENHNMLQQVVNKQSRKLNIFYSVVSVLGENVDTLKTNVTLLMMCTIYSCP